MNPPINIYLKKIKNRFLLATIFVLTLAGAAMYYHQYSHILEEQHYDISVNHDNIHKTYTFMLEELKNNLNMHSMMLLSSDKLRKSIFNKDRRRLQQLIGPFYELLKEDNPYLEIMTFRDHDGTVLLRLHKPELYGDMLHKGRKIIISTNKKNISHYGFEVGKLGMTYRLVSPIFYQDKYIGSLELGVAPDYILQSLNKITDTKNALLIKAEEASASLNLDLLTKHKHFYLTKSDPFFLDKLSSLDLNAHEETYLYEGHHFSTNTDLDLLDYTGRVTGKILLAFNIDRQFEKTDLLQQSTLSFIVILVSVLILILHYGFSYFISRLSRSQEELEIYKERLELAFSGSTDGLWDWNMTDNSVYFSPRWKGMLGYEEDELENQLDTWKKRLHPDDIENVLQEVQAHIDKKTPTFENIHRLKHKDGSWVWILDRGKVFYSNEGTAVRFIGTHTDITKEKKLENKILDMNTDLEEKIEERTVEQNTLLSLFDAGSSVLFKWNNDETWTVAHVSKSVKQLLGYEVEQFLNNEISYASCIHKEDLPRVMKEVNAAFKNNKEHFHHEPYRLYTKDGEIRWVYDYTVIVRDKNNNVIHFIGYTTDITEIKEKDKRFLQQTRMAQMGEMISMIAHQWRQPLGAISAVAIDMKIKIALEKYHLSDEDERQKFYEEFNSGFDKIDFFTQELSSTIDDFRNFYKSDKKPVFTTIETPLKKALNIIQSSLTKYYILVEKDFQSTSSIPIYDSELLQVYLNILKNSQDNFITNKTAHPLIKIRTRDTESSVCIEIEDNGGGIAKELLERIFDPYFSTKDEKNGTGLGLYMSKTIIEDHHKGCLRVMNYEDGVCFCIELPKKEALKALEAETLQAETLSIV